MSESPIKTDEGQETKTSSITSAMDWMKTQMELRKAKKQLNIDNPGLKKIRDNIKAYNEFKKKQLNSIKLKYYNISQESNGVTFNDIKIKGKLDGNGNPTDETFKILQPDVVENREEDINQYNKYYDKDINTIGNLLDEKKEPVETPSYAKILEVEKAEKEKKFKALEEKETQLEKDRQKTADLLEKLEKENADRQKLADSNIWERIKIYLLKNLTFSPAQTALARQLDNVEDNKSLLVFEFDRLGLGKEIEAWMNNSEPVGITDPTNKNISIVFKCKKKGFWGIKMIKTNLGGIGFSDTSEIKYFENLKNSRGENDSIIVDMGSIGKTKLELFKESANQDKTQCEEPEPVAADAAVAKEGENPVAEGGKKKRKTNKKRKTLRRKRRSKKHL